jgi:hypothetical protein
MAPRSTASRSTLLYDPEDVQSAVAFMAFEPMPGLIHEMRNVDDRERVGTFQHQDTADRNIAERLLGPQHRLRTLQAAQVKYRFAARVFSHDGSWLHPGRASPVHDARMFSIGIGPHNGCARKRPGDCGGQAEKVGEVCAPSLGSQVMRHANNNATVYLERSMEKSVAGGF